MQTFHMSEQFVAEELIGAQGWAMFSWATENRAIIFGSGIERKGRGYVGQEIDHIMERKRHH